MKRKLKFQNYRNCLQATQLNKIVLSSNDDKRMESIDSIKI